ncbi:MAG: hypothetical protein ACE5DI_04305 [Candidatus Micrarchaeia archaeon]
MVEQEEFRQIAGEFKKFNHDMKNPLVVGALLHKLSEERSSSNLLFKEINAKLDRLLSLERRVDGIEKLLETKTAKKTVLSETDEEIVGLARELGRVCAADVKKKFGYRGLNAACARLSRLFQQGLLEKVQAGKKVYYLPVN